MVWFFVALLSPFFWAISNHIDKYLLSKYFKDGGAGALMIFSAIIGFFVLPVIYFIEPGAVHIQLSHAIILGLSGCLYAFGFLPYFYAISKNEASVVVPLFQLIPVFSYFLGLIFLQEYLNFSQIVASLFVIIGAILVSLDFSRKNKLFKAKVFWLMVLSSFIFALNSGRYPFLRTIFTHFDLRRLGHKIGLGAF